MTIYDPISKALGITPLENFTFNIETILKENPPFKVPPTNLVEISERMKKNNPMKNPAISSKVAAANRGKPAKNKIEKTFTWRCEECDKSEERRDTVKLRKYRFCNKSCAGSHENRLRWKDPIYTKRVGEAISKAKRT